MENLSKEEQALYDQIVATGDMKLMFDWARSVGRLEIMQETIEKVNF
jgi:hypothetical protein